MLLTGQKAPDVQFIDARGQKVGLHQLLAGKTTVLYFYPKDFTAGCTVEACAFRDQYEDFVKAGAQVIGVSMDSPESHEEFSAKHRLPFTLVSDPDRKSAVALGVTTVLGVLAGRVTFVINKNGVVEHRFESRIRMNKHVEEALEVVKSLVARAA